MDRIRRAVTGLLVALACCGAFDSTPSPSPRPTATPNPYRSIEFASPTLNSKPQEGIAIVGGWAAVKRDATAAVVCVSFKNEGSVAATRVLFKFHLMNREGVDLGDLTLDRRGTFAPGVNIHGWGSLADWQSGMGNRGYNDNCTTLSGGIARMPLLSVRYVTYRVTHVDRIGEVNNGVSPP